MSKNLTRKGLALVSGAALALSSLVGIAAPAIAAPGDLKLTPTTGSGTLAFSTDIFSMTADILGEAAGGPTTASLPTRLAYRIDNPDQHQLFIQLGGGISGGTAVGYKSTGEAVTTALGAIGAAKLTVDFKDLGISSLVLHTLTGADASTTISIALDEATVTNATLNSTLNPLEYGDLSSDATVTVQAWYESSATANFATVDTIYASEKVDLTFTDPSSVSVISRVERFAGAYGLPDYDFIVRLADNGNNIATTVDAGDAVGGENLVEDDLFLLITNTTESQDGIYVAGAATAGSARAAGTTVANLIGKVVLVSAGTLAGQYILLSSDGAGGLTGTYITPGSDTSKFDAFNAGGQAYIGGSLRFSKAVNLDQVDLTQWKYALDSSVNADDVSSSQIDLRTTTETFTQANADIQLLTPAGYRASNKSAFGRLLFRGAVTDNELADGATYRFVFEHNGDNKTTPSEFSSPAVQVIENTVAADADRIKAAPSDAKNAKVGTYSSGFPVSLRNGTNTVSYVAQVLDDADDSSEEVANVPVMAVVTAGAFFPTGAALTVSGATETIKTASGTIVVNGLTDSKGKWTVSVTSSDASAAGSAYNIQFYVLDQATPDAWTSLAAGGTNSALYKADYVTAAAQTLKSNSEVVAGTENTVTFTIEDQFEQPIAQTSTGRAYSVEFSAADKDDLDKDVVAADGTATFTFTNWLTAGESEVLTARVYTGSSTSPVFTSVSDTVMLYSVVPVTAVNVNKEDLSVVVSYVDFIEGKTSVAAPGPVATTGTAYTGTVVDANGAGIPGAPVTVAAEGFQFLYDGRYFKDSVTLMTNEAGTFTLEYWTTKASATGISLTATSGDKVGTTLVKSAVPIAGTSVSTRNLSFSWNIPATLVMNTTYAVTASVTDKHGNGVANAFVKFSGFGAAQFNGVNEVTRSTDRNGQITVFLRSLKDVDGPSAIGAELTGIGGATDVSRFIAGQDLTAVYTDVATTSWDESKWTSVLETPVNFLKSASDAPAASADAKVNAGSFNGYVAVYAKGYKGQTLSWKIAGQWFKTTITEDYQVFQRTTAAVGVDVTVELYINGQRPAALVKQVLTR